MRMYEPKKVKLIISMAAWLHLLLFIAKYTCLYSFYTKTSPKFIPYLMIVKAFFILDFSFQFNFFLFISNT